MSSACQEQDTSSMRLLFTNLQVESVNVIKANTNAIKQTYNTIVWTKEGRLCPLFQKNQAVNVQFNAQYIMKISMD